MIAGALENTRFADFEVAQLLVFAGMASILLIGLSIVCAPFFSLRLSDDGQKISKKYTFFGIILLHRDFEKGTVVIKNEAKMVFASDILATQESSKLVVVAEDESIKLVISDLERTLFKVDLHSFSQRTDKGTELLSEES